MAAGVVAIILGALAAFSNLLALLLFSSARFSATAPFPAALRPVMNGFWIFFLLCGVFVVISGVQAIRLRNWARISLLIIAGCLFFFGVVGIVVIFVTLYLTPMPDPNISKALLASVLGVVYGIPILISVWWLILFTRRAVAAQFQNFSALSATSAPASASNAASLFNNPMCPLPVRIVGWYLASFVFFLPLLPFIPARLPAYLFGHVFVGPAASGIYFLSFALLVVSGFGLLLLKRWSYRLNYATQILTCVNLVSVFSPSYEQSMKCSHDELPDLILGADQRVHYTRYLATFTAYSIAILSPFFVCQRRFTQPPTERQRLTQLQTDRAKAISAALRLNLPLHSCTISLFPVQTVCCTCKHFHAHRAALCYHFYPGSGGWPRLLNLHAVPPSPVALFAFCFRAAPSNLTASPGLPATGRSSPSGHSGMQGDPIHVDL